MPRLVSVSLSLSLPLLNVGEGELGLKFEMSPPGFPATVKKVANSHNLTNNNVRLLAPSHLFH
jgi:hypothetical protein